MVVVGVVVSYLVASVSFPYWIARAKGVDLRRVGSRKLGGSNLAKTLGLWYGVAGGLLDAAKGFMAPSAAFALGLPLEAQLACGVAAIVGQLWPLFHRFDGGRANATSWGFALAADPIAFVIMMLPVVAAIAMRYTLGSTSTRLIPLANILTFAVFPAVINETDGRTPPVIAGLVVLGLLLARRISAGLPDDLTTGAPLTRVLANRALFDRSELQERGQVAI